MKIVFEDSIILMNYVFLLSILLSPSLTDFFKGHMVSFLCLKPGKKIDNILAVGVTSLMYKKVYHLELVENKQAKHYETLHIRQLIIKKNIRKRLNELENEKKCIKVL